MYTQTKPFIPSNGGTTPYMCLANVRAGYSITKLLPDAWTAWQNTEQHKNRTIPVGVDVPLFYSFIATIGGVRKNWGHINVRYRDGRVWNDGKFYASLAAFEQAYGNVSYVGWGESVNNERVIKGAPVAKVTRKLTWATRRNYYLIEPSYSQNIPSGTKGGPTLYPKGTVFDIGEYTEWDNGSRFYRSKAAVKAGTMRGFGRSKLERAETGNIKSVVI